MINVIVILLNWLPQEVHKMYSLFAMVYFKPYIFLSYTLFLTALWQFTLFCLWGVSYALTVAMCKNILQF